MASKRDQLKKLKESRTQQTIEEMSSPAEDKLKELEKQEELVESQKDPKEIESVSEFKNQELTRNSELKEKKEAEKADESTVISVVIPQEEKTALKREDKGQSKVEMPEKSETKEKTKRTSMALLVENNKFIRLRAMQLGYSIQNYVNLLIEEEIARSKTESEINLMEITDNLDMNYRRGQNSTIVALVLKESNAKFLKRGGAMLGMNATNFLNYIISEEQKREKENGPRKGEFDE